MQIARRAFLLSGGAVLASLVRPAEAAGGGSFQRLIKFDEPRGRSEPIAPGMTMRVTLRFHPTRPNIAPIYRAWVHARADDRLGVSVRVVEGSTRLRPYTRASATLEISAPLNVTLTTYWVYLEIADAALNRRWLFRLAVPAVAELPAQATFRNR
jgi:hypothetical protein